MGSLYVYHNSVSVVFPGKNRFGTSPVRVESPDLSSYPNFAEAEYEEAILGPGDVLYIPRSHWHYVRALSTSVSVNFWF